MDIRIDANTVIVFDLDDTLYHEIDYLKSAYKALALEFDPDNWSVLYAEMFSLYRKKENAFRCIAERYNAPIEELIEKYRMHKPAIQLFEGAKNVMTFLKDNQITMALVTDGRSITQRNKIEALGITEAFSKIVISEELGTEKPHVNNFKTIMEAFGEKTYYYIADNIKKDFVAPKQLGWKTIGIIDDGLNIHNNTADYLEPAHIPDFFCFGCVDIQFVID